MTAPERPTCGTCRWWEPGFVIPRPPEQKRGECRIRAPMARVFPLTSKGDWCGEHTPKETEETDG